VLKFSDTTFQANMRAAIANGYVVLIQDVEEALDPSIETILGKQYKEVDGRVLIRFGDQEIDFDRNFKLFITTKIPNPNYLPEIFIKVTVINFTVTFEGLEDQLLADVVKQERPEIEKQKDDNVMNLARYRKSIKESESTILR
jgi:dynein heavy chain